MPYPNDALSLWIVLGAVEMLQDGVREPAIHSRKENKEPLCPMRVKDPAKS
jgi:hypothetical protein